MAPIPSFRHRHAVLATMHGKEQVIAPLLAQDLGVTVTVPPGLNTDGFGTFTRDIPRCGTQLEAARQKAITALELTGADLALASEGTFGPHPAVPWVACDRELVLLIDRLHQLEIVGEALSTETNYAHQVVSSVQEALAFGKTVNFPSHGLVAMPDQPAPPPETIYKGLVSVEALTQAVEQLLSDRDAIRLETDMRAHVNPSRMAVIRQATENLITQCRQTCPACEWPGFAIKRRLPGLPCRLCGTPTSRILSLIYGCSHCGHEHRVLHPDGQTAADPGQCGFCNP